MGTKLGYRPKLHWDEGVHKYLNAAYGSDRFSRICEALMQPSKYSSIRVNSLQTTSKDVILELKKCLSGNENCFEHPLLKNVVVVQGDGPHQLDYDDTQKIIVVSRKCAESVLRGAEVYVPGVLACSEHVEEGDTVAIFARIEVKDNSGKYSNGMTRGTTIPLTNWESLLGKYYEDWFIGKGRAMMSRSTLFKEREGTAVKLTDRIYNLPALHGVLEGKIFLQNLPSIITALVLDPKPGEMILDMCAAPGGKSTAIATLMNNTGEVVAFDRTHNKVLGILNLAKELGISCIKAFKKDALKSVKEDTPKSRPTNAFKHPLEQEVQSFMADLAEVNIPAANSKESIPAADSDILGRYISKAKERKQARRMKNGPGRGQQLGGRVEESPSFAPNTFDRVLLDAPCSALGLRPRLFTAEETLETLGRHANYQKKMFDRAVQLVKPSGTIVYSTCTINPGENEALVRYALNKYKFLTLAPQTPRIGGPGLVGGTDVFDDRGHREWLKEGEEDLVQRFDPSGPEDTIGFFIAKFQVSATKNN